jgi:hypothetical protein
MEVGTVNAAVTQTQDRGDEQQLWAEADKKVKKFKPWLFVFSFFGVFGHLAWNAGHTLAGLHVDTERYSDGTAIIVAGCLLTLAIVLLHLILALGTFRENEDNVRTYLKYAPIFMAVRLYYERL